MTGMILRKSMRSMMICLGQAALAVETEAANHQIPGRFQARLKQQSDNLNQAVAALNDAAKEEVRLRLSRDSDLAQLNLCLRAFWKALRLRADLDRQLGEVRRFFTMPQPMSKYLRALELLQWARETLDSEGKAVTAGWPAMVQPTAEELTIRLTNAETSFKAWEVSVRVLKKRQAAATEERDKGVQTMQALARYLHLDFSNHSKSRRRELMRTFGFEFAQQKGGEAGDDEPVEPPVGEGESPVEEPGATMEGPAEEVLS